jgi:hypothetical protein
MDLVSAPVKTTHRGEGDSVGFIKCNDIFVEVSFADTQKDDIALVFTKVFIGGLYFGCIGLAESSAGGEEVQDHDLVVIQVRE